MTKASTTKASTKTEPAPDGSPHAPPPRGSPHAPPPRGSPQTPRDRRGARAFAEMAASAAARVASHATSEVFARLSLGLGRIARSAEPLSEGKVGRRGGTRPTCRRSRARRRARWNPRATEPQHARDARDGVEALASAGGFDIPRETWDALDASDARWRRRETAFIAAQCTFEQGLAAAQRCTVTSRRRRRPRRGDGEGGETPLGKIARGGGESVGATREVPRRDARRRRRRRPRGCPAERGTAGDVRRTRVD